MEPDGKRKRGDILKQKKTIEKTTFFLAVFIIFLGTMFMTRPREILLKQEVLTGLGVALNLCIALGQALRRDFVIASVACAAAAGPLVVLIMQIFF